MDLRTYLIENEIAQETFARRLNLSLTTINKLCSKRGSPNLDVAISIVKATGGDVRYEDLTVIREKKPKKPRMKRAGLVKRRLQTQSPLKSAQTVI